MRFHSYYPAVRQYVRILQFKNIKPHWLIKQVTVNRFGIGSALAEKTKSFR